MNDREILLTTSLKNFSKVSSIYNPRYKYYSNKLSVLLRQEYNKKELSSEFLSGITQQKSLYTKGSKDLMMYRILSEFDTFNSRGSYILDLVNFNYLDGVLKACKDLLVLKDPEIFNGILSDSNLTERILYHCDRCNNFAHEDEFTTNIYEELELLYRLIVAADNRGTLGDLSNTAMQVYLNICEELLKRDKEFYYLPSSDNTSGIKLSYFTRSEEKEKDDYLSYYIALFRLKALKEMFLNTRDYHKILDDLYEECNKIGLGDCNLRVLKISIRGQILDEVNTSVIDAIVISVSNDIRDLAIIEFPTLSAVLRLARDFCEFFTKDKLLKYVLEVTDIEYNQKGIEGEGSEIYNFILHEYLSYLSEYGIISAIELEEQYDMHKRSGIDEKNL